ncbi:unnamed protein product [Rhizoctonia solani]|uniref:Uncharacterized protein n=1 Tax=Rhizoctonia solani TaxID=456999 RepID=A0A8H3GID7_9AGAM|nr:unnamed protein product [Rhizoctonia solani]
MSNPLEPNLLLSGMRFGSIVVSGLLVVAGSSFSSPAVVSAVSQGRSSRFIIGSERRGAQRNRLYACSGNDFGGSCTYVPVPQLGSCIPTPDELHDALASVRTQEGSALLYQGENCAGTSVQVDVRGISGIRGTVYRSWFVPA